MEVRVHGYAHDHEVPFRPSHELTLRKMLDASMTYATVSNNTLTRGPMSLKSAKWTIQMRTSRCKLEINKVSETQ